MKNYFYILSITIFLTGCASKNDNTLPSTLDKVYIQRATDFAKAQFECCMTDKYVPITKDIATPWLVREWNEEEERKTCQEINERFGNLTELKIAKTQYYKENYIYRFKVKYSKLNEYSEIRVYTTLDHKFSAYIIKEVWLDKYTKFNPKK
jgi:hypothetical protein